MLLTFLLRGGSRNAFDGGRLSGRWRLIAVDGTLRGGSAGLCIYAGSVKVRNSIFYGNRIAESGTYGCDLKLNESSSRADVDYTLFGSTSESNVYNVVGAQLNMGPTGSERRARQPRCLR